MFFNHILNTIELLANNWSAHTELTHIESRLNTIECKIVIESFISNGYVTVADIINAYYEGEERKWVANFLKIVVDKQRAENEQL